MKAVVTNETSQELRTAAVNNQPIAVEKILVPIDFSPASEKSLKYAERLAKDFKAELILLHVCEADTPLAFPAMPAPASFSEKESVCTKADLSSRVESARAAGVVRTRWMIRAGVASHEIIEVSKELAIDLIVIAAHGFTDWRHFAIGSTAERVARAADCTVLVVREKEHDLI